MDKKNKTWAFTLNNYADPDDINLFRNIQPECSRMVVSREQGESGTPHLQGAITFRAAKRLSALKKLHSRAHWEPAISSDPFTYCCKDGSVVEINHDSREQGKRNDLVELCKYMKEAKRTKREIAENHPTAVIKYGVGIQRLMQWQLEPRTEPPEVYWYWGKTGAGKTREVHEKEKDLWANSKNLDWFDGYIGQEAALFDDLRAKTCEFEWLLRLTDRYPLSVPVKGGFVEWVPKRVYITCDRTPQQIYSEEGGRIDQLIRRITLIKEFD